MPYNRRDDLGHWVNREKPAGQLCEHACCRGYRQHPKGTPVIMPARSLRRKSDDELVTYFRQVTRDPSSKARTAELQVMHEMERRDRADEQRRDRAARHEQHREAVAANRAARRQEREAEEHRIRLEAEAHTGGYLVNPTGRARGISDREILTGPAAVFERYATDEAKDYFAAHPRPTASHFRGRDTRYVPRATEPRRRKRGVTVPRKTRALGWSKPLPDLRRRRYDDRAGLTAAAHRSRMERRQLVKHRAQFPPIPVHLPRDRLDHCL